MKSIVLLSSGLDSTVAFKEAFDKCDEVFCVTFDYGQRAREKKYLLQVRYVNIIKWVILS